MRIPLSDLEQITQYLQNEQKAEAVAHLRQVLTANPNNIQALIWLGGLTSNPREAMIALERAIRLAPDNKIAQHYLERWQALQVGKRLIAEYSQQNIETLTLRKSHRLAILIDGDNAQPSLIDRTIVAAQKYGALQIKRIYGDWTNPAMKRWKQKLHRYAIQPIQQFQYTTGKNATDSALIIDAMDILNTGQIDGFCLVSSDSDYTRLATRIAEDGFFVMGIGKKRTPRAFINACNLFIYSEDLITKSAQSNHKPAAKQLEPRLQNGRHENPNGTGITSLLKEAFEQAVQPDGRAYLGTIGLHLQRLDPGFEPRKYGYRQLSQLVKAQSGFKIEMAASKIYVELNGA